MVIDSRQRGPSALSALSDREHEVLCRLAEGHTYGAIARSLGLSTHTVDTYVRRIRAKTGVHNRMQLILLALGAEGRVPVSRSTDTGTENP